MKSRTDTRVYEVKQFSEVGEVSVVRRWFFKFFSEDEPTVSMTVQAEPRSSGIMDREPEKKWQVDDFGDVPKEVRKELEQTLENDLNTFKD